jgi:hypothetical protein
MSVFKELYYWIFWYIRKDKKGTDRQKADSAYLLICLLQSLNLLMVYGIIKFFITIKLSKEECIYYGITLALILMAINRFYLFNKRKEIFEKYEHETIRQRQKGKIMFWLYIACTIFTFYYLAFILGIPITK